MDAARSYPAIRAPIDTLPNELLSDIFTMGAASPPSYWGWPFPLIVSSISRRWREAAISSPPLWSQLFFTVDVRSDRRCANSFLPRSGAHPLDISIDLLGRRGSANVVRQLLPYSERWRKLCIRVSDNYDSEVLAIKSYIRYTSVPLLQHFELLFEGECGDGVGNPHSVHTTFFEPGAPALTSVKLRGLCLNCAPAPANLTSYRFDSRFTTMTQSQMESIAAASPALRVLHLRLERFEESESGSINLPSLQELSLNFPRWSRIKPLHIFAILLAPVLESLELVSLHDNDVHGPNSILQRFPNYPRLQTLKLSKFDCLSEHYGTLLGLFPTITSLYFLDNLGDKPTLSLLPALKHITYNNVPRRYQDGRGLWWLCIHVQKYCGTPQAIESLHIGSSMCGDHKSAHYRTLRDLVNLVELPNDADSFQDSWSSDEEEEDDDESDDKDEEDDEDDRDDREDHMEDGNSDYELDFEDENAWGSDS